jgi:hypothetical protein
MFDLPQGGALPNMRSDSAPIGIGALLRRFVTLE